MFVIDERQLCMGETVSAAGFIARSTLVRERAGRSEPDAIYGFL